MRMNCEDKVVSDLAILGSFLKKCFLVATPLETSIRGAFDDTYHEESYDFETSSMCPLCRHVLMLDFSIWSTMD